MTYYILNPNKIWYNNHNLCDGPWERHWQLGLQPYTDNLFLPYQLRGIFLI